MLSTCNFKSGTCSCVLLTANTFLKDFPFSGPFYTVREIQRDANISKHDSKLVLRNAPKSLETFKNGSKELSKMRTTVHNLVCCLSSHSSVLVHEIFFPEQLPFRTGRIQRLSTLPPYFQVYIRTTVPTGYRTACAVAPRKAQGLAESSQSHRCDLTELLGTVLYHIFCPRSQPYKSDDGSMKISCTAFVLLQRSLSLTIIISYQSAAVTLVQITLVEELSQSYDFSQSHV